MTVIKLNTEESNTMFIKIAQFQYSSEAQIIKGRLEADGVEVFLADNHTIDTDPLVSNAIGGVKLMVYSKDEDKALGILKSINRYSVDDSGKAIICPNCSSEKIDYFTNIKDIKSLISFLFGFIMGVFPFYTKHEYHCEDCKTKFNI